LRPYLDHEEVEAPIGKIDEHRLIRRKGSAIPPDPRRDVVDGERNKHHQPLEAAEVAARPFREDLLPGRVEGLALLRRIHRLDIVALGGWRFRKHGWSHFRCGQLRPEPQVALIQVNVKRGERLRSLPSPL
jgi:hypothetical protein